MAFGFTPWAILISALFGAATAIVVIAKQRIMAQKQAAIQFMVMLKTDGDYKKDEQIFAGLAKTDNLPKIMVATTAAELQDRISVLNYLNMFEVLCVAIRQNVLDENVCKAVIGDSLVQRWKNAQDLIVEIRKDTKDDEFFEHFETIKKSWQANPKIVEQHPVVRLWKEIGRL